MRAEAVLGGLSLAGLDVPPLAWGSPLYLWALTRQLAPFCFFPVSLTLPSFLSIHRRAQLCPCALPTHCSISFQDRMGSNLWLLFPLPPHSSNHCPLACRLNGRLHLPLNQWWCPIGQWRARCPLLNPG